MSSDSKSRFPSAREVAPIRKHSPMWRGFAAGLVLLLGLASLGAIARLPASAAVTQESTYFRLKIGLSHKGEPIDMDIVVGCGVRITDSRLTGVSIDIMSMYPFVYARPIPGGHAVLVRTREIAGDYRLCRGGTTANGAVPKDWLPFIVWYDNADDLSHGIGYLTQDAYENPNAQLEFHGAVVESAAKQDFDEFLATKPTNLVPAYNADALGHLDAPAIRSAKDITLEIAADPRKAWSKSGWPRCRGAKLLPLSERQRLRADQAWPSERPQFWAPSDAAVQRELRYQMLAGSRSMDLSHYTRSDTPERQASRIAVYPISIDYSLARLRPNTGSNSVYYHDVLINDLANNKGFIQCDVEAPEPLEAIVASRQERTVRISGYDIPLSRANIVCRVGDYIIPVKYFQCDTTFWVVFIRDEYAIVALETFII
jgi:hypothetical protein